MCLVFWGFVLDGKRGGALAVAVEGVGVGGVVRAKMGEGAAGYGAYEVMVTRSQMRSMLPRISGDVVLFLVRK